MFSSIKAQYRASLKSSDTEEHIDLAFYRPIGFAWALLFRHLHISPNMVTIASIFIGIAAGICLYPSPLFINIAGLLLLVVANSLDSADGQLARMTGRYSRIGRILDGMAGDLWFLSIYIAIVLHTIRDSAFFGNYPYLIWILAMAAGVCHGRQAAIADYFRQFHLMFVKKEFPDELENSATILDNYRQARRSNCLKAIFLKLYYLYTLTQERETPAMQRLLGELSTRHHGDAVPETLAANLRRATLPLCKWENFLTFNWRSITLAVCVVIGMPYIYFIMELTVFNAVYIYLIRRHEQICREMAEMIAPDAQPSSHLTSGDEIQ